MESQRQAVEKAASPTVRMTQDLKFNPSELTIPVGTAVTWTNDSSLTHTVTCDPGKAADPANIQLPDGAQPFDSGSLSQGQTFSHQFTVAGVYRYVCRPHERAGMQGRITVQS